MCPESRSVPRITTRSAETELQACEARSISMSRGAHRRGPRRYRGIRGQATLAVREPRLGAADAASRTSALLPPCSWPASRQPSKPTDGGRYWDRTSDLFRVREARYRCANRPESSSAGQGREWRWRRDSNPCKRLCRPVPSLSATPPRGSNPTACSPGREPRTRADDETRTRDPHLGKVMRYQLRYIRVALRISPAHVRL